MRPDGRRQEARGGSHDAGYARLLWLLRVVGTIALYGEGGPAGDVPTGVEIVESVWRAVQGMDPAAVPEQHDLWAVSRNRAVQLSTWKSVVSTKADAATRLFDLSCSKLTWAVIDSASMPGIPRSADAPVRKRWVSTWTRSGAARA